jgi:hypothetical protein
VLRPLFALTAALVAAVLALGLPSAPAQTPGDTVTVTNEPPGDNCEFGGVKITVTHAEPTPEPTEDPTEEPTPDPTEDPTPDPSETPMASTAQDEPDVTYVCNGQSGDPGQDGMDGSDGQDGTDGLDGMDADPDTPGVQAVRSNRCATAGIIRVRVARRFHNRSRVKVTTNGRRVTRRVRKHKVAANLKTVPCGFYPVLVQRRGLRSQLIVLRLTSHRVVRWSVS